MSSIIRTISVLVDNYVHVIHDPDTQITVCIDPADDPKIIRTVKEWGWSISHVLVTHPHYDHVDGIADVVDAFGADVYASRFDFAIVPNCTHGVQDGDSLRLGGLDFQVMAVPGHMAHHIAFYLKSARALFSGDTLFSLGCGRLLGGTASELWASLKKIRALPEDTKIYFSHEYTESNAEFAQHIDPSNKYLKNKIKEIKRLRSKHLPTVPVILADEIKCNPFLRCDDKAFQNTLGLCGHLAKDVFAEIRRQKDHF